MFRLGNGPPPRFYRFPRIRGDVPDRARFYIKEATFSPHTRGCSCALNCFIWQHQVFPAYAGMFPLTGGNRIIAYGFPRIRGDVPHWLRLNPTGLRFSPHTRGCSWQRELAESGRAVFPAYAGMFPSHVGAIKNAEGFPRIRGDVPFQDSGGMKPVSFSPHTRGCSASSL